MRDTDQSEDFDEEMESLEIIGDASDDTIPVVVSSLPADVRIWVIQNITFVDFTGLSGLACHVATSFPSEHRCKAEFGNIRLLIILSPQDGEFDDRKQFRVAHEIAHHWSGHHLGSAIAREDYERQECEADALANAWGFPGKSDRV